MNCGICGLPMAHYRLYGYRCTPRCEEAKHQAIRAQIRKTRREKKKEIKP